MYQFCNNFTRHASFAAITISAFVTVSPTLAQDSTASVVEALAETQVVILTPEQEFAAAFAVFASEGGSQLATYTEFYEARDFQPIWADGNPKNMLALLTALEQAPTHGLPVERYNTTALEDLWMAGSSPEQLAALELAAAQSYTIFAQDMTSGMLNPRSIHREMNGTRYVPEISDVMANAAAAKDMVAFYKGLAIDTDEYNGLLELKRDLETLVSSEGWGPLVPSGRTLRPGQTTDRVLALRVRLNQRDYDVGDLTSPVYDDALVEVVKLFQTDFGLNADGLAGPQTLSSINAQPDGRLKQVIVNLERVRWMNYDLGDRHIYVNIPDFRASVVDNGEDTLNFRIVVGTGRNQTAEFSDTMTHMIANPTWHVPNSIASEEYLPKLQNDPTVLARSNIRMLVRGSGQEVDSTMIDYSAYTEDNFPFVLQQRPSRSNALGRVKFMFPNKYNIYLHDTPSKSLFNRDARAYSHGCVRVQNPFDLAHTLLSLQEDDPESAFDAVLRTGRETRIDLAAPIPVHLVYRTVWIDGEGDAQYRHDVYGRDKLVFKALAAAGVTIPDVQG